MAGVGEFLAFTDTRGGLAGLDAGVIDAFVATLAGYQAKTVEHETVRRAVAATVRRPRETGQPGCAGGGPGGEVDQAGQPAFRS